MFGYGLFLYSLDKIKFSGRLRTPTKRLEGILYNYVQTWIDTRLPSGFTCVKCGETLLPFRYRYWFDIRSRDEEEGTFHIESFYNGDFKNSKMLPKAFQVEFNPNKRGLAVWRSFCDHFSFTITQIKKFDIAYDLPGADWRDVYLDTKADVMKYGKTTRQTLYVAPKADNGRVKVYQKDKEREEHGQAMDKTLRIECTIRPEDIFKDGFYTDGKTIDCLATAVLHLNAVKIRKEIADSGGDWKLFALARLSPEDLERALSMMAPQARRKYKTSLLGISETVTLNLDVFLLLTHCTNILSPYLERMKI